MGGNGGRLDAFIGKVPVNLLVRAPWRVCHDWSVDVLTAACLNLGGRSSMKRMALVSIVLTGALLAPTAGGQVRPRALDADVIRKFARKKSCRQPPPLRIGAAHHKIDLETGSRPSILLTIR